MHAEDVHRADANRLEKKNQRRTLGSTEVLRFWFHHHLLVRWSLILWIHSGSLKLFQAQLQRQEVYHTTSRMGRSRREYYARRNKVERCRPFFVFNSSTSNRILSSRELIMLSDSNCWCVWGSCAVCCGLFSHEDRHTARTQHRTGTHSTVSL